MTSVEFAKMSCGDSALDEFPGSEQGFLSIVEFAKTELNEAKSSPIEANFANQRVVAGRRILKIEIH